MNILGKELPDEFDLLVLCAGIEWDVDAEEWVPSQATASDQFEVPVYGFLRPLAAAHFLGMLPEGCWPERIIFAIGRPLYLEKLDMGGEITEAGIYSSAFFHNYWSAFGQIPGPVHREEHSVDMRTAFLQVFAQSVQRPYIVITNTYDRSRAEDLARGLNTRAECYCLAAEMILEVSDPTKWKPRILDIQSQTAYRQRLSIELDMPPA